MSTRAKKIMTLAMGVGISNEQSEKLVADKLEEFRREDSAARHPDTELIDWLEKKLEDCEGRLLTRVFMPDGQPLREKLNEARRRFP